MSMQLLTDVSAAGWLDPLLQHTDIHLRLDSPVPKLSLWHTRAGAFITIWGDCFVVVSIKTVLTFVSQKKYHQSFSLTTFFLFWNLIKTGGSLLSQWGSEKHARNSKEANKTKPNLLQLMCCIASSPFHNCIELKDWSDMNVCCTVWIQLNMWKNKAARTSCLTTWASANKGAAVRCLYFHG